MFKKQFETFCGSFFSVVVKFSSFVVCKLNNCMCYVCEFEDVSVLVWQFPKVLFQGQASICGRLCYEVISCIHCIC